MLPETVANNISLVDWNNSSIECCWDMFTNSIANHAWGLKSANFAINYIEMYGRWILWYFILIICMANKHAIDKQISRKSEHSPGGHVQKPKNKNSSILLYRELSANNMAALSPVFYRKGALVFYPAKGTSYCMYCTISCYLLISISKPANILWPKFGVRKVHKSWTVTTNPW